MWERPRHDPLQAPGADAPLRSRIWEIHWAVRSFMPFVARVAVAIYEPGTALLRLFVHSGGSDDPAPHYPLPDDDKRSLRRLLDERHPRVIRNPLTFEGNGPERPARLGRTGFAASYTLPMFSNGAFLGFVFFNSHESDAFTETVPSQLGVVGHLASLLVIQEVATIRTLSSSMQGADPEAGVPEAGTGSHLDRLSRYAGLVARRLVDRTGLDGEFVERLEAFAPLHDIGNLGIPDEILLKPDSLTREEVAVVRTHANRGQAIVEDLITHFGLGSLSDMDQARNIVLHHHERVDGAGYPHGLAGGAIPLEARIVAVADVFDALTSKRPYRGAFANDVALGMLREMAGSHLDDECVRALADGREEIERIQNRFAEDPVG